LFFLRSILQLQYTNTYQTLSTAVDHVVQQAKMFVETDQCCGGMFPYEKTRELESMSHPSAQLKDLGFSEELTFLNGYTVNGKQ